MMRKTIKLIFVTVTFGAALNARQVTNDFCMHNCLNEFDDFQAKYFDKKGWKESCKDQCTTDNPWIDDQDRKRRELEKDLGIKFNFPKDQMEWCGRWKHQ